MNRVDGGCARDFGWLVANGPSERTCDGSTRLPAVSIIYARGTTAQRWNGYPNIGIADVLTVYAR